MSCFTPLARQVRSTLNGGQGLLVLIGFAVVLVMLTHLFSLTSFPPVFIDEPWIANAAWNWLQTGIHFDAMHSGTLDQFGYEWVRRPFIGDGLWSVTFSILGLGLLQARLVSWIFGILLLGVLVSVGRRSYGWMTGLLAAFLLSLSLPFLVASHYARLDIVLAAIVMAAYLFALKALDEDRWWAHFLAGLLLGLSLDIHQNGLIFAIGLAALYLSTYRLRFLRKRGSWLCALGGLVGVAYYLIVHILPNPDAYFDLYSFHMTGVQKPPVMALSLRSLLASACGEFGRYDFFTNNLTLALVGASIAYLLARHSKSDRRLLVFVGTTLAGFVLFVGNKTSLYAILFYPFFMLMIAEAFVSLMREGQRPNRGRVFAGGLLALFLFSSAWHYVSPLQQSQKYDYYAITDRIEGMIPLGARVMGLPNWWLGLAGYDYRSSLNLTFRHIYSGQSLHEALAADRPGILIVDRDLRALLVAEGAPPLEGAREYYKLPRQEFESFLAQRGEKLLEFTDSWHGDFEIYAIHWE